MAVNPDKVNKKIHLEEEDPFELVAIRCSGGNLDETVKIIIEEYIKLGFDESRILWLFKNPFFKYTNDIYKLKGENYIKKSIEEVKNKWLKFA